MLTQRPRPGKLGILLLTLMIGAVCAPTAVDAQPSKKRVKKQPAPREKSRAQPERERSRAQPDREKSRAVPDRERSRMVPPREARQKRIRPRKTYVRPRRDFRHVRVAQCQRYDDGRLNARPIILRSARVTPLVLNRFQDRRRDNLHLVIQHFKEGRRGRALEIWGGFVDSLADYGEPIDLDDVMLYVARESCYREDDRVSFYASKLEFLREFEEQLEDYLDELYDQRDACTRRSRPCSSETLENIQTELIRTQADREILGIRARAANDQFEINLRSSGDYEQRFAAAFDSMYREVELKIRFSP